jgi:uncharacterized protein (UPF0332 family)
MDNNRKLSEYRFNEAERCQSSARLLFEASDYKSAANRSYYSVFNAMRSILALQGKDFKKHSALISHFRSEYIKTGIFDDKMSDILRDLFFLRGKSDYDDFYVVEKKEIESQIENADYFLEQVKNYLSSE